MFLQGSGPLLDPADLPVGLNDSELAGMIGQLTTSQSLECRPDLLAIVDVYLVGPKMRITVQFVGRPSPKRFNRRTQICDANWIELDQSEDAIAPIPQGAKEITLGRSPLWPISGPCIRG